MTTISGKPVKKVNPKIQTFIFFDLETTGLIQGSKIPKITEMSLVAVFRDDICQNKETLPRVLHKLVIPFYPNMKIPVNVSLLTNLYSKNLESSKPFQAETYDLIMQFINRLLPPVCFVAHNGNRFDYPILLHEFQQIEKDLPSEILCVDTLVGFKDFFDKTNTTEEHSNIVRNKPSNYDAQRANITCHDYSLLLNDGFDEVLSNTLDSFVDMNLIKSEMATLDRTSQEYSCTNTPSTSSQTTTIEFEQVDCTSQSTPQHKRCYRTMQEINEKTPIRQIIKLENTNLIKKLHRKKDIARKRLPFSKKPSNYKLSTVYEHMIGHLPDHMHTAEGDCLTMLRCCSQFGNTFIEWADCNATPLITYKIT